MSQRRQRLPRIAVFLGVAGIVPQVFALLATFSEGDRYTGLAAGFFYAALILSFLGGLWWGIAATRDDAPDWLFVAAVLPSLIALASGVPWMTGDTWPGPSLYLLGVAIIATAVIDAVLCRRGLIAADLLRLRMILSVGLGVLTLTLAMR